MHLHSEGLLQLLLTLVLGAALVRSRLHDGLGMDQDELVDLLALIDSYPDAGQAAIPVPRGSVEEGEVEGLWAGGWGNPNWPATTPPPKRARQPSRVRIIHKEEPFFRPMRKSKEREASARKPSRWVDSRSSAEAPSGHGTPKQRKGSHSPRKHEWSERESRALMSRMERKRDENAAPSPRWRKATRKPSVKPTPAWTWDAGKAEGGRKGRNAGGVRGRRNVVGAPVVRVDLPPDRDSYVAPMRLSDEEPARPPRFPEYGRRRNRRPPTLEEPRRDPLESPITRMAVAVALGALVTCAVYGVAFVIAKLFPKFFGSDDSAEDEILQKAGRPVRYVPVPAAHAPLAQTTMV